MYDLGLLFEAKNMNLEARDFFQCCLYYRHLHRWKINTDLEYKKQYYEINEKLKPDLIKLKKITISVLRKSLNIGIIKMINQKEKFGFIKINNQKDIYFKTFTIQNKTHFLPIGTFVEYDIERIKDQIRAVNIRGL